MDVGEDVVVTVSCIYCGSERGTQHFEENATGGLLSWKLTSKLKMAESDAMIKVLYKLVR